MVLTTLHAINGLRDTAEGASVIGDIQARFTQGNDFMLAMDSAPMAASTATVSRFNR